MITSILEFVVKIVDSVPIFKGKRTFIILACLGVGAGLDAFGVVEGLYNRISPYLWPLATATALAHKSPTKNSLVEGL